jgi:amyloid beta precursor protein binding protein 1
MATSDKYDRQLRLWGSNGQRALMESSILLINADAPGTETLKNLVLPGLGKFTILDSSTVTGADASSNFFVNVSSIGSSRAQVCCLFEYFSTKCFLRFAPNCYAK